MHSYLVVGKNEVGKKAEIEKLLRNLTLKPQYYSVKSIKDIRDLSSVTRLALSDKTAIIVENIDEATDEALNAFLKNLEEPQENLTYILTASSLSKVLPTISSRSAVIKVSGKEIREKSIYQNFFTLSLNDKMQTIDKIRIREDALQFVTDLIFTAHNDLINGENKEKTTLNIEILFKTLNNLNLNGNVVLQLTNMVINLV